MKVLIRRLRSIGSGSTSLSAIAYVLGGRVGVVIMNVGTAIVMARALGPSGKGTASAIGLWPLLTSGVITFGIPVAIRYTLRRKADDSGQLLTVALTIMLGLGFAGMIAGIFLMPFWMAQYSPAVIRFAQIVMIFTPIQMVYLLIQGFLDSQGKFARSSSMVYVPPLGTLISVLVLWRVHELNIYTVPIAYEAPFSCMALFNLYRVRHYIRPPKEFLRRSRLLLGFGIRAYGLDILNTLSSQIGQVVGIGLLTAGSFGLYTVALNASRTLALVSGSLNTVLFPKASELEPEDAVALVARSGRMIFAINATAGVMLYFAMPFLLRVAYGSAYAAAIPLAQLLTIEAIIGSTSGTFAQAFMATNRPGLVTILQGVGLCITFPLMLLFIPKFGLIGAGYALLTSTSVRFVLVLTSYPLFLQHRVPRLLVTLQDLRDVRKTGEGWLSARRSSA